VLSSYLFPRITSNVVFGLLSLNARVQLVIDDFFMPILGILDFQLHVVKALRLQQELLQMKKMPE